MQQVKLHDKTFEIYIPETEISAIVHSLATAINNSGVQKPLFIAVMNGAFLFAADIMRQITVANAEISFIKLSSYQGLESSCEVNELIGISEDISGRNIIVLEDIIDTGDTLVKITDLLKNKNIQSLKIVTLLCKNEVYDKVIPIDLIGKNIPNDFVVGYGLDYDEIGRNLPHIYKLKKEEKQC